MKLPEEFNNIALVDLADNYSEHSDTSTTDYSSDYNLSDYLDLTPEFIDESKISSQNNCVDYEEFVYNPEAFTIQFSQESTLNNQHIISENVLDLVLQHLPYQDLKEASVVSKHWYMRIAKSENLMKKLKLVINVYCNDDPEEFLLLLSSKRQYADVELVVNNDRQTMNFMEAICIKFSKSIENLKIIKYGGHLNFLKRELPFDKLTSIELFSVCSTLSTTFLGEVSTLKKIVIDGIEPNAVKKLLILNPDVEELILYENSFITYLNLDLSSIYMNLKSFAIFDHFNSGLKLPGEFEAVEWARTHRERLKSFLFHQSPTLTTLRLDKCYVGDFNSIISSLPNLKSLEVNKILGDANKIKFLPITSVKTFIAMSIDDVFLQKIVEHFEEISSIYIHHAKINQLLWLLRNSMNVENCGYFWLSFNALAGERSINSLSDILGISIDVLAGSSTKAVKVYKSSKKNFIKEFF
jgi:hypothetical protein